MNIVDDGRKDIQSLVVRDLLVAQRKPSEKIRLLYQDMEWIGFISGCSIRLKVCQLSLQVRLMSCGWDQSGMVNARVTTAGSGAYSSTKGPDVCWRAPFQVQHCFWAPEDRCSDDVPIFFRVCGWVLSIGFTANNQLYFAERVWPSP